MPFTSTYSLRTVLDNFQANGFTDVDQRQDRDDLTVGLAGGGFAVAYRTSPGLVGPHITFFDADGVQVGANVPLPGGITAGGIAAFDDGSLLVIWGAGLQQYASRYSATGVKIGGDIELPEHDPDDAPLGDLGVTVETLADGGFLRVLNRTINDVWVERFDANGNLVSAGIADDNAEDGSLGRLADVVELSDGGYVVVFQNRHSALVIAGQTDVRATVYNADGSMRASGVHILGADNDDNYGLPQVAALQNGGFVVISRHTSASFSDGIVEMIVSFCSPQGAVVRDVVLRASYFEGADITVLDSGDVMISFIGSPRLPGGVVGELGVWGQMFSATGAVRGLDGSNAPFLISSTLGAPSGQRFTNLSALDNGSAVVTWVSPSDGSGDGIAGEVVQLVRNVLGSAASETWHGSVLAEDVNGLGSGDRLYGAAGDDTLRGDSGNDRLYGGDDNDVLEGGDQDDTLEGGTGRDTLQGGAGNDTLEGGAGQDTLDGGQGSDTYLLSDFAGGYDVAQEDAGNTGVDLLLITAIGSGPSDPFEYMLGAGIENGRVATTGDFDLIGNDLANRLTGNLDSNHLEGGLGFDTLVGGDGDDWYILSDLALVGGTGPDPGTPTYDRVIETDPHTTNPDLADGGIDTVLIALVGTGAGAPKRYVLGEFLDNLRVTGTGDFELVGNTLANDLRGNNEANRLDGQGGRDTLQGFGGDDVYVLSSVTGGTGAPLPVYDLVIEQADGGTDTVIVQRGTGLLTPSSYTLTANVEIGIINGTASFSLNGNALNNTLTGNDAANTLRGQDGNDTIKGGAGNDSLFGGDAADRLNGGANNDTLDGGTGNDQLTGGGGADQFVFTGAWGVDRITDFADGIDTINLASLRDENGGVAIALNQLLLTQVGTVVRIALDLDQNGVADVIDLDENSTADVVRIDVLGATVAQLTTGADFVF